MSRVLNSLHLVHSIHYPEANTFLLDSGCSTTTILSDDATNLAINCSTLKPANPVATANGQVTPYKIPEAILIFQARYGLLNLSGGLQGTKLTNIHCHIPTNPLLMNKQRMDNAFSLLGMDFLKRFKTWKFGKDHLSLST